MVTLLEAVIFPTFLITKGEINTCGMFGNVKEDAEVWFAKLSKGWRDDVLGYRWLTESYHPYSLRRMHPGEKRLLFLMIVPCMLTYNSVSFVKLTILWFVYRCTPPTFYNPLDIGLFASL